MNSTDIINREKLLTQRQRNRTLLWLRLCAGVTTILTKPWKCIFVVLLCAASLFAWNMRDTLSNAFTRGSPPILSTICEYLIAALIPLLFLLLLAGLLTLLGTPLRAKAMECALLQIGLADRYGNAPALISCQRVKGTSVSIWAFYSLGVGLERWEKRSSEVQDALNVYFVEPIRFGGRNGCNRNIIVITAAPGAETYREGAPYDDEL